MKALPRLLISLCLTACVASANAELSPVAFAISRQQFKPGDGIVIEQVLATSPKLKVGDKVVVRGHHQLASASKASLGLLAAHRSPAGPDSIAQSQTKRVEQASGLFELSCDITYAGDMHVSFYPTAGGEAFGGAYFTTGPKSAKNGRARLRWFRGAKPTQDSG